MLTKVTKVKLVVNHSNHSQFKSRLNVLELGDPFKYLLCISPIPRLIRTCFSPNLRLTLACNNYSVISSPLALSEAFSCSECFHPTCGQRCEFKCPEEIGVNHLEAYITDRVVLSQLNAMKSSCRRLRSRSHRV